MNDQKVLGAVGAAAGGGGTGAGGSVVCKVSYCSRVTKHTKSVVLLVYVSKRAKKISKNKKLAGGSLSINTTYRLAAAIRSR